MPQKLLIADDEQKSVIPLTAILEAEGYVVDAAADGQKALDMLNGPAAWEGGDADTVAVLAAHGIRATADGVALRLTFPAP